MVKDPKRLLIYYKFFSLIHKNVDNKLERKFFCLSSVHGVNVGLYSRQLLISYAKCYYSFFKKTNFGHLLQIVKVSSLETPLFLRNRHPK